MAFIKRSTVKTIKNIKIGSCTEICSLCGVPFVSDVPKTLCVHCSKSENTKNKSK